MTWDFWRSREERLRRSTSMWIGRMHGPNADLYRAEYLAWRQSDSRHADAFDRLAQQWQVSSLLGAGVERSSQEKSLLQAKAQLARPALIGALGSALLLVLGYSVWSLSPKASQASATMFVSRHGQLRALVLPDGSKLILDADSALSVRFDNAERTLALTKGRARFSTGHDPARPFVVSTAAGSVTALGTAFDVELQPGGADVVLLRGEVDIRPTGQNARNALHAEQPGQRIHLGGGRVTVTATAGQSPRWPNGMLDFDQTPLVAAAAEINRYNDVQIVVRAPSNHRLTGGFHARDPEAFARAMASLFHLRQSIDNAGNIVLSP